MKRFGSVLLLVLAGAAACDTLYSRDVTAIVTGPGTVQIGQTVLLTVRLDYSDGATLPLGPSMVGSVNWMSSNNSIATVDSFGAVTGVAAGAVTITATPSLTTTGTGQRTAGTHQMTVQ